jgi:YNFM family putative membrane transporter
VVAVFLAVTLVTCGFFLQHATIAALLNAYAADRASDVNSMYVAFYYVGGTAGSYLPGLVYASVGWSYFVGLLLIMMSLSIGVAWQTMRAGHAFLKVS